MEVKEAYDLIGSIIIKGFIQSKFSCGELFCVLKSISDKEYGLLDNYVRPEDKSGSSASKLAVSTYFLNGINMIPDRDTKIQQMISFYKNLPVTIISRMISVVEDLHYTFLEAIEYLEGFCYTKYSRVLWKSIGLSVSSGMNVSGIQGSEVFGINNIQENWILINRGMDDEEAYGRDFHLSTMVASSFNPKGVKVISNNFEFHRKEVEEARKDIAKYGYDKKRIEEQRRENEWTAPIKTREDLVRELNRQMRGEKDKHDQFIDVWIERQKKQAEDTKLRIEEEQKAFRAKLDEKFSSINVEESAPVSSEYVEEIMKKRRVTSASIESVDKIQDKDKFIKKVGSQIIRSFD